jgi:hypothetical protein
MLASVHSESRSNDPLPVCLLRCENSNRLVSLWNMVEFTASEYASCCFTLHDLTASAYGIENDDPAAQAENVADILSGLTKLSKFCRGMGLDCVEMIERISQNIDGGGLKSAHDLIGEIQYALLKETRGRKCYLLTKAESRLFDWAPSSSIATAFPASVSELTNAAQCLALGRAHAVVFHSMNALECPLRALARYFIVPFNNATSWGTAIGSIKDKIDKIDRLGKRGVRKTEILTFYGEAAKEFSYFNAAWRIHVMHGRAEYDRHSARSIWEHVVQFTDKLSKRLSVRSRSKCPI